MAQVRYKTKRGNETSFGSGKPAYTPRLYWVAYTIQLGKPVTVEQPGLKRNEATMRARKILALWGVPGQSDVILLRSPEDPRSIECRWVVLPNGHVKRML